MPLTFGKPLAWAAIKVTSPTWGLSLLFGIYCFTAIFKAFSYPTSVPLGQCLVCWAGTTCSITRNWDIDFQYATLKILSRGGLRDTLQLARLKNILWIPLKSFQLWHMPMLRIVGVVARTINVQQAAKSKEPGQLRFLLDHGRHSVRLGASQQHLQGQVFNDTVHSLSSEHSFTNAEHSCWTSLVRHERNDLFSGS